MTITSLVDTLSAIQVVPVIALNDVDDARHLAEQLSRNNLKCAEVTFRTPKAVEVMKIFKSEFPDIFLGAGTVLKNDHVDQAIDAGADFVVSPGLNPDTIRYAKSKNIDIIPGINSPSLVEQGIALGLDTFKFFPAVPSGGVAMLKALQAVYNIHIMVTGGINPANVAEFLALDKVFCCGGSWMVPDTLIQQKNWTAIGQLIAEVKSLVPVLE